MPTTGKTGEFMSQMRVLFSKEERKCHFQGSLTIVSVEIALIGITEDEIKHFYPTAKGGEFNVFTQDIRRSHSPSLPAFQRKRQTHDQSRE